MSEQNKKPDSRPPDWLDDDDQDEIPAWAELPRLEVGDQASGSMSFCFPSVPVVPVAPPAENRPAGLMPPPPGMIVVNDDFAALNRLSKSKLGTRPPSPTPEGVPAPEPKSPTNHSLPGTNGL